MFDFTDLDLFTLDAPHKEFARLRSDTPVYWNPMASGAGSNDGFWLVTRYRDIVEIEKNPGIFSSHFGLTLEDAPSAKASPPWAMVRDGLTHLDPPEHTAHRKIIAPLFTPKAIRAMEARIQSIAEEVIDRACKLAQCDFATEVALRFPVQAVLGELLGLPREDFARAVYWSDVIAAPKDPQFGRMAGIAVVQEIHRYALSVLALRRREPADDVLSILAHTQFDGASMSDEVFVRYFWSLLTGAFDTTASAIAGGMLALIEHPDEFDKLMDSPSQAPAAVEEILRWETPTIYFRRTARCESEIHGQKISMGQRIVMCYASGNRDEEVFPDAACFDVTRTPNEHLSFGHGQHYCLGSTIARAEIRILFEQICRRKLAVKQCGSIRRARSNFQNRIKSMPVSIGAR